MPEKTPPPRPRMHKGECIDELSGKILPTEDCLTKSGKPKTKFHQEKEMIIDGVKKHCVWVEPTTFTREPSTINRKQYTRKKDTRKGYTRKEYTKESCKCPKENPKCAENEKICSPITIPATKIKETTYKTKTIKATSFEVPKKEIEKKGFWSCSLIGD